MAAKAGAKHRRHPDAVATVGPTRLLAGHARLSSQIYFSVFLQDFVNPAFSFFLTCLFFLQLKFYFFVQCGKATVVYYLINF